MIHNKYKTDWFEKKNGYWFRLLNDQSLDTVTGNQITGLEQYYRLAVLKE